MHRNRREGVAVAIAEDGVRADLFHALNELGLPGLGASESAAQSASEAELSPAAAAFSPVPALGLGRRRVPALVQLLPQPSAILVSTLLAVGFTLSIMVSLRVAGSARLELPDASIATIWLGNGVQLGALLLLRRRWWTACLSGLGLISVALMLVTGGSISQAVTTSMINLLEVLFAACMLGRDPDWVSGRSDRVTSWLRFAVWGVIAAPLAGTGMGVLTLVTVFHQRFDLAGTWHQSHIWYVTDALAICTIVPLMVRLRTGTIEQLRRQERLRDLIGLGLLLMAIAVAVMCQPNVIALFVVLLPLIALVFRLGFAGVAAGMAALSAILLGFTRAGQGPFITMAEGSPVQAVLLAQTFVMVMFATVVLIGSLLDERQQLAARESANEQVYRMIAATSSDMILVLTDECAAKYVSPAASELAGRPEHALVGMGWLNQIHAEDRDDLYRAFNAVRDGDVTEGEAVCRLLRREGDWRWLEFRLRRSRSDGAPLVPAGPSQKLGVPSVAAAAGLTVATVRDVTGRKEHEETLRAQNLQLAHDATTDALTGLPNRREFEHRLTTEWRRALRSKQPLSLLVIDIDFFKRYNDTYGHAEGDRCLAEVAQALKGALRRPADMCFRYGGEEFVALLPNTGQAGGHAVAQVLCAAVRRLQIKHSGNDTGYTTISVGSATAIPEGPAAAELFARADLALYRAKGAGRDRAEMFDEELDAPQEVPFDPFDPYGEDDGTGTGTDHITGRNTA